MLFLFILTLLTWSSQASNKAPPGPNSQDAGNCNHTFIPETSLPTSVAQVILELAQLRFDQDVAKVSNHNAAKLSLESEYRKKEQAAIAYVLANHLLTAESLRGKIREQIEHLKGSNPETISEQPSLRGTQTKHLKEILNDGSSLVMHRMEPGEFEMLVAGGNPVHVILTEPFELAATPVTQVVYRRIVLLGQKYFPNKYQKIEPSPSEFSSHDPDNPYVNDLHPVENVSWNDSQTWIKLLNQLSALDNTTVQEELQSLITGHQQKARYGLPKEEQWAFVMQSEGTNSWTFYFGEDEELLEKHAWYAENSDGSTHPVTWREPLNIKGKSFYDLSGNVWEWMQTRESSIPKTSKKFQSSKIDALCVIRGGAWVSAPCDLRSTARFTQHPDERIYSIGFRLMRIIH